MQAADAANQDMVDQLIARGALRGAALIAAFRATPRHRVLCRLWPHRDRRLGWPDGAPYDRIQVTAASEDLEPAWLSQLNDGGLIQVPIDLAPGLAWIVQGAVSGGVFTGRLTRPAYFMPLRDEGEPGR